MATKVTEAAESQMNNKAALRSMLRDAERALLAGEIDEDAYDVIETDILLRMKAARE